MRAVNETAAVNEALRASDRMLKQDRISQKKLKKLLKNLLTKSRRCDIILKPICEAENRARRTEYHEKS